MASEHILVAGVGNMFLGDDGFGCEVARRLADEPMPDGVRVADYGTGGVHLAFDLLDGWDALVLIDAHPRGGEPGKVYKVEVDLNEITAGVPDAHGMDPATVLATLRALGGEPPPTVLVGCEPADTGERLGLSSVAEAAVEPTVAAVRELIDELRADVGAEPPSYQEQ